MSTFAAAYEARRSERARTDWLRANRNKKQRVYCKTNSKRAALDRVKTERGCQRCEVKGLPPAAYDFHHRDPSTKKFALAAANARGLTWEKIESEIAKCDVLCATCHRIVEHEARQMSL